LGTEKERAATEVAALLDASLPKRNIPETDFTSIKKGGVKSWLPS
jgi:hypothetical protein